MALGDLTKQLAQQALLTATSKEPAAPQPESLSGVILKIFVPSRQLAVLSGTDSERHFTRVISPIESLQLVCKVIKVPAGAKPTRVNLVTRKTNE